jgi:hypothetical protein
VGEVSSTGRCSMAGYVVCGLLREVVGRVFSDKECRDEERNKRRGRRRKRYRKAEGEREG